jgi:simple sugar transport system ATP-binding protein
VGENGAGKSSLMNVLYGLYQPDGGQVCFDGAPVRLKSPKEAIARGIGMVHQHFMLVPGFTVAENVALGAEPSRFGRLDRSRAEALVEDTCRRFGFALDPSAKVGALSVGSQQKVEIVKALAKGARVLILDEPTAVLTPQEADELFTICRALSGAGHTVVFISHKLEEVLSVATRIAVMRRGRKVAEVAPAESSPEALAALMVGQAPPAQAAHAAARVGAPVLQLSAVSAKDDQGLPALREVSLEVRAGEIVGIAGVDGNGQSELAQVLTGLRRASAGEVRLSGERVERLDAHGLRGKGVGHVPEDRHLRAMVGALTVEENVALGRHTAAPFAKGPWIDRAGRRARAGKLVQAYDVRPADALSRMGALSGGNQQKVVLAREVDAAPRLLVVVQPTRGLDIAAVAAVHQRLRAVRDEGTAVLLISLDLDEVLALSDRVYALYDGRITGTLSRDAFDARRLGRLMLGAADGPEVAAAEPVPSGVESGHG